MLSHYPVISFRVYEPEMFRLVQTNVGHTDAVRTIIHVPERNQVRLLKAICYYGYFCIQVLNVEDRNSLH